MASTRRSSRSYDPASFFDFTDYPDEIRYKGRRIRINEVLVPYLQGMVPEQIRMWYPSLSMSKILAAIDYYERNRQDIDRYLAAAREHSERAREEQRLDPHPGVRRLRELKASRLASGEAGDVNVSAT